MRKIYQQVPKYHLLIFLWHKMRLKNILQNHQSVADFGNLLLRIILKIK